MGTYDPRYLITPPKEEEEVYPYRRVWPSLLLELGGLFGAALALFAVSRLVAIPPALHPPALALIALFPGALWLRFSWQREHAVPEPRQHLLLVAVVTALAAGAVGVPFVRDVLRVDEWLPLSGAVNRIIGYTFTVGIVQELIRYLVLRYTVWPGYFRTRLDGVAYGVAGAVGCALALNLNFMLTTQAELDIAAMRVFDETVRQVAGGIIVGYGLAEVRFNPRPFPLLLPAALFFAALVTGIAIPVTSGLANVALSVSAPVTAASPLRGFLFSAVLMAAVAGVMIFLFTIAVRQDQEAAAVGEG